MISKAKRILIKTKRQVLSEIIGNNASLFKGEGYSFSEIREYLPGEDIRKIDWVITAKLQKPFVKEFFEERELNVVTVSMLGGSMLFGSKKLKQETLAEIVSTIGFSSIYNQDKFSNYIYSPHYKTHLRESKKQTYLRQGVEDILSVNPLGSKIDLVQVQKDLQNRIKKKSVLFFIGDFIGYEPYLHALSRKHEVIALIVRDRLEEDPSALGQLNSIDPNTKQNSSVYLGGRTANAYKKAIYENDQNLFKYFRKHKIKFKKIYTHEPCIKALRELFYRA